jgi:cell fate (sporulation/competence/biofilm development) regulator YmcA (YheA/YmcA/DUF963 family)
MTTFDDTFNQELAALVKLVADSEVVREYQALQARVSQHAKLNELEADIKQAQQAATNFAHYGQMEAEKAELAKVVALQAQFDTHPLVVAYRESLIEANDLLQHITTLVQKEINEGLEEEL